MCQTGGQPLLAVRDLVQEFVVRGRGVRGAVVHAVSGVSFDVHAGETLGVVGETDSGKSTLARAVLQAPRPRSGSVTFRGSDLVRLRAAGCWRPGGTCRWCSRIRSARWTPLHPYTGVQPATMPVCCGTSRAQAQRRADSLGEPGARLLSLGVAGEPADVLARLAGLSAAGADTTYFHIYDPADLDHIRLLGTEVVPEAKSLTPHPAEKVLLPAGPQPVTRRATISPRQACGAGR